MHPAVAESGVAATAATPNDGATAWVMQMYLSLLAGLASRFLFSFPNHTQRPLISAVLGFTT